jgi:hypothetical protein
VDETSFVSLECRFTLPRLSFGIRYDLPLNYCYSLAFVRAYYLGVKIVNESDRSSSPIDLLFDQVGVIEDV